MIAIHFGHGAEGDPQRLQHELSDNKCSCQRYVRPLRSK